MVLVSEQELVTSVVATVVGHTALEPMQRARIDLITLLTQTRKVAELMESHFLEEATPNVLQRKESFANFLSQSTGMKRFFF